MESIPPRYVPKVHPITRPVEPDDPMTLNATLVAGDPEVMLQCVVQEYAWMGWRAEQILGLFRDPFYPALHDLLDLYGEVGLRERVAAILRQTGVLHFQATVIESPEPEPEEEDFELIQLGIRTYPQATKGASHGTSL